MRGQSTPWTAFEQDAAFDLRVALLDAVLRRIQAVAKEREIAYAKQQLLMAELDHRVKNTLANIQALVTQTSSSATSLKEFATALVQRIQAMARVHSLLTTTRWDGVSLRQLILEELSPHDDGAGRIEVRSRDLTLTSKAALALSLALHELTTNAAKYGSLSVPAGKVVVRWRFLQSDELEIAWTEIGGPAVVPPTTAGFGSVLIGRALELETGGKSQVEFKPNGVVCRLTLPPSVVAADQPLEDSVAPQTPAAIKIVGGSKKRILLVEDSGLVIMMIEDLIEDLGWELIGPATRVSEAVELAQVGAIDAALIDLNLDGEMSLPVVEILAERRIPFALTTGYDSNTALPATLEGAKVIGKPFAKDTIRDWLLETLQKSESDEATLLVEETPHLPRA